MKSVAVSEYLSKSHISYMLAYMYSRESQFLQKINMNGIQNVLDLAK
jgi:hypothetical protein